MAQDFEGRGSSTIIDIDPWLIDPLFAGCTGVDFQERTGEECLAANVDVLLFRIRAKYRGSAALLRQNQRSGLFGQRDAVGVILQQGVVHAVIAYQHRPQQLLAIAADHQLAVDLGDLAGVVLVGTSQDSDLVILADRH
mgnify:CR=1 FL=1